MRSQRLAFTVSIIAAIAVQASFQPAFAVETAAPVANAVKADTVNGRIALLENVINNAYTAGQLTNEQSDNFRSQLGHITEEEAEYQAVAGKLDTWQEARLQVALDAVEKDFALSLHDRKVAALDVNHTINAISARIDTAAKDGLLKAPDAEQLQNEKKAVRELEKSLVADGNLSYGDSLVLSMHVDRVVHDFGLALGHRPVQAPNLDQLQSDASQRLTELSGKVSADVEKQIRDTYDKAVSSKIALKNVKDEWHRTEESLRIAAQFDLVSQRASMAAQGKALATTAQDHEAALDQAISNGLANGHLLPNEAHELFSELTGIIAEQKQNASNPDQAARTQLELARLQARLEQTAHQANILWAGLPATQAAFDAHVNDAIAAGRITQEQGTELKTAADKLAKLFVDDKASDNRLDASEALDVAIQLERLQVKLHNEMKDREVNPPDLAKLHQQLDRLVADGIESGRLQNDSWLTNKLAHITEIEDSYAKLPTGLDDRAKLAVAEAIERQIASIESVMHHDRASAGSIDARLNKLQEQISDAVAWGGLTVERAAQYKAAADTITNQLWNARKSDKGLSATDSLAIADDVTQITEQLHDELQDSALLARELRGRYRQIMITIGDAVADGRMTINEANTLVDILDRATKLHVAAISTGGGISHGEALKIGFDMDLVAAEVQKKLRDEPLPIADVGHQLIALDSKLANALASGKITIKEADEFKNELTDILTTSAHFRTTGNTLSYPETLAISMEIDKLGKSIDSAVIASKGGADVDARQADLAKRIKLALSSKKLTQKDADALNDSLDRIGLSEAAFRTSDEGLSYAEAVTLAKDLDTVNARLESLSRGQITLKGKH